MKTSCDPWYAQSEMNTRIVTGQLLSQLIVSEVFFSVVYWKRVCFSTDLITVRSYTRRCFVFDFIHLAWSFHNSYVVYMACIATSYLGLANTTPSGCITVYPFSIVQTSGLLLLFRHHGLHYCKLCKYHISERFSKLVNLYP